MFFPNGNAEEFCDHVFRTFDRDKNGFIDFKVSHNFKSLSLKATGGSVAFSHDFSTREPIKSDP